MADFGVIPRRAGDDVAPVGWTGPGAWTTVGLTYSVAWGSARPGTPRLDYDHRWTGPGAWTAAALTHFVAWGGERVSKPATEGSGGGGGGGGGTEVPTTGQLWPR